MRPGYARGCEERHAPRPAGLHIVVPDKPPIKDIQQDVFDCFTGAFETLGKNFNLNRKLDNRLANLAFKSAANLREKEIKAFPASFRMGG